MVAVAAGISIACKIALAIAAACAAAGAAEAGANLLKDYNKSNTATDKDKEATNGWLDTYAERGNIPELWGNEVKQETAKAAETDFNASKQEQIDGIQGNYDAGTYQENYDSNLKAIEKLTAKAGDFDFTEEQTTGGMLPGSKEDEEKYDKGSSIGVPGAGEEEQPGIKDETDTNLGTNNISAMDWMKWAEEEQAKRWAREDAIRAETQAREDTAWQRGVEDMRKSGINVNLVAAQPAASGGGITQASGQNIEGATTQMNIDLDKMQQMIENAFKGDENEKDRFIDAFQTIISFIAVAAALKR